jgi:hypothetical protein
MYRKRVYAALPDPETPITFTCGLNGEFTLVFNTFQLHRTRQFVGVSPWFCKDLRGTQGSQVLIQKAACLSQCSAQHHPSQSGLLQGSDANKMRCISDAARFAKEIGARRGP